jgi:glycosyltransferase involved in cell wall biosynthesis
VRILLIHNAYRSGSPGGEDIVFETERDLLVSAGHDVFVYRRSNDEVFGASISSKLRAGVSMLVPAVVERDVARAIIKCKPDVAHFHNVFPLIGTAGYAAAVQHSVPIVQTIHNYRWSCAAATHFFRGSVCTDCAPQRFRKAVIRRCYRDSRFASWAVGQSSERIWRTWQDRSIVRRFIALTSFMAQRLVEAGLPADRITVKPNCVTTPLAVQDEPKEKYVVYSGRLSVEKGLLTMLEAWRRLNGLPLKIIGDGPLFETIKGVIAKERLSIELLGYLPPKQAQQVVARAALQVVPSQWFEGMPLVVLEAWSLGTPVLVSNIGGLREMVSSELDGLHFEAGNPTDLVTKVEVLMSDPSRRRALALAGRKTVEGRCSAEETLRTLTEIYVDVIAR